MDAAEQQILTSDTDIARAAQCLKAMSHPLRLKILCTLGNEKISVQEIVDRVGTTQSNISQHLGILRDKGILGCQKDANRVYYFIDNPNTLQLIHKLRDIFCTHVR